MKTYLTKVVILSSFVLLLASCSNTKTIHDVEYDTYGLLNADENKNPNIQYKICWGNVVWGTILSETIVAPIYFFGFDLFEPVRWKYPNGIKGQVYHENKER